MLTTAGISALMAVVTSLITCAFFFGRLTGRVEKVEESNTKMAGRIDKKAPADTVMKIEARVKGFERDYVLVKVCDANQRNMCQMFADIKTVTKDADTKLDAMLAFQGQVNEFMANLRRNSDGH